MRKCPPIVWLLVCGFVLLTGPAAQAQSLRLGPGGIEIDPGLDRRDRRYRDYVDSREARRIARRSGMDHIDSISQYRGRWIVEGTDWRDRDMEVHIDARDGDVIRVVRRR